MNQLIQLSNRPPVDAHVLNSLQNLLFEFLGCLNFRFGNHKSHRKLTTKYSVTTEQRNVFALMLCYNIYQKKAWKLGVNPATLLYLKQSNIGLAMSLNI